MRMSRPDFSAAIFHNHLLNKRLEIIMADLQDYLGCSLPQACRSRAALEATYRFLDHPETSVANLLPALVLPAVRSLSCERIVLVVHDSTSFNFTHLRKASGLGYINDSVSARGIHLHSSLLLDEDCILIGFAHLHFWVRHSFREETGEQIRNLPIEQKESFKWLLGIRTAHTAFQTLKTQGQTRLPKLIDVMDREGDIHEVFAELQYLGHDGVIRCAQNRRVKGDPPDQIEYAKQRVTGQQPLGTMELCVPLKEGGSRTALVEVRSLQVLLQPDQTKHEVRQALESWLIECGKIGLVQARVTLCRMRNWRNTLSGNELRRNRSSQSVTLPSAL